MTIIRYLFVFLKFLFGLLGFLACLAFIAFVGLSMLALYGPIIASMLLLAWRSLQWMFSPPYYFGTFPIIIIVAGTIWISIRPAVNRRQWNKLLEEAEDGDTVSMVIVSYAYEHGNEYVEKDIQRAFELVRKAAEAGNSTAMNKLGYMYARGDGVEQNRSEALKWISRAIIGDNTGAALCNAGYIDWLGSNSISAVEGKKMAAECFRASIKFGSDMGMLGMGCLYALGEGVEQDKEKAIDWIRKAAQAGNRVAAYSLKKICGEEIAVKPRPAIKLPWEGTGLDFSTLFCFAGSIGIIIFFGGMAKFIVSNASEMLDSLSSNHPSVRDFLGQIYIETRSLCSSDILRYASLAFLFFATFVFTWGGIEGLYGKEFWKTGAKSDDTEKRRITAQGYIYGFAFLVNIIAAWRGFRNWYDLENAFVVPSLLFCIGYTVGVIVLIACINVITNRTGIAQDNEERRKHISVWLVIGCLALGTFFLLVRGLA